MKVYYHNRDLDGFCSGAILKHRYPDAEFIGYDYGMPFEMPDNERVIMVDVSLSKELMFELAARNELTWIDHHKSAIDELRDLPCEKVTQVGVAACELTWYWCYPNSSTPVAVTLLGKYDTWRKDEEWEVNTLPFQYGMRALCNGLESFPTTLLEFTNPSNEVDECIKIIESGKLILAYQAQQDELHCKLYAFEAWVGEHKAICLNTTNKNSNTFLSVYDHDLMVAFTLTPKGYSVSLYTTKDIDVSAIAKLYGGGGHKQAAGFITNTLDEFLWIEGYNYVNIDKIDEPEKAALIKWLDGQTCPLIPDCNACYTWDYKRFKNYYENNLTAPVYD